MPPTEPRSRRPAEETRSLMLATAIERVRADGLRLDYANIELEDLIRAAGVPRSTVFRIWPDRAAFVTDLVRAVFEADSGFENGFDDPTVEMLEQAIAGDPTVDLGTPEGRAAALRTTIRLTVGHNIVAVEGTVAWRTYRTVTAALASGHGIHDNTEIRALLGEIEERYISRMAAMYSRLNAALGLRMRAGLSERDLALAIMAVIDGTSDHRFIVPDMVDEPRTVALGPEGPVAWHIAGLAVYGVYTALTLGADARS